MLANTQMGAVQIRVGLELADLGEGAWDYQRAKRLAGSSMLLCLSNRTLREGHGRGQVRGTKTIHCPIPWRLFIY